jgi:hypothetical protein
LGFAGLALQKGIWRAMRERFDGWESREPDVIDVQTTVLVQARARAKRGDVAGHLAPKEKSGSEQLPVGLR